MATGATSSRLQHLRRSISGYLRAIAIASTCKREGRGCGCSTWIEVGTKVDEVLGATNVIAGEVIYGPWALILYRTTCVVDSDVEIGMNRFGKNAQN
jgi:hypothetical protein